MPSSASAPYALNVPYGSRLIYALLLERAGPDRTVRISYEKIAESLDTTIMSAKRMIEALVDAGVVSRELVDRGYVYRIEGEGE